MQLKIVDYKNIALKIFSLFLAIVVWFYINNELQKNTGGPPAYKDLKAVEIKLMGDALTLGKNVFIAELENKTIDIRLKGPEQELEKLTALDTIAYVNISGLKSGKVYSPVVNFILPPNIKLVGSSPVVRVEIKEKTL